MSDNTNFGTVTLRDLYEYIQTAERDELGFHIPVLDRVDHGWKFHIYNGLHQVNLIYHDQTLVNFVFDGDEVAIYKVRNNVADYDNPTRLSVDTEIGLDAFRWSIIYTDMVAETLSNVLTPFVQKGHGDE